MTYLENKIEKWHSEEKEHPSSDIEWWCTEAFFKTIEDQKTWSLKTVFTHWFKKNKSKCNVTLFEHDKNKKYIYYSQDKTKTLTSHEHEFGISYQRSFLKGLFPKYGLYVDDNQNNIKIHMNYHSKVNPHWVAEEITDALLPMGFGFYKYGFIPKCDLLGELEIKNKKYNVNGTGYFEHVWGDFSFEHPLANFNLKKSAVTYAKSIIWWLHNHKIKIPKTIKFSTENNPFGYDWIWGILDNGWTLFYGNIMLFVMQGTAAGLLYLFKNQTKPKLFCDITFKYNKMNYCKKYDFYYPSDLSIIAKHKDEKIVLNFKTNMDSREYISLFSNSRFWTGLAICEIPGFLDGEYTKDGENIKLRGICKLEPQRQISKIGHNSLKLNFLLPPKGIGTDIKIDSNYFDKKIHGKLRLTPNPGIKLFLKRKK